MNPESKNRMDGAAWSTVNGAAIEAEAPEEKKKETMDDRPAVAGLGRGMQKASDSSCVRGKCSSERSDRPSDMRNMEGAIPSSSGQAQAPVTVNQPILGPGTRLRVREAPAALLTEGAIPSSSGQAQAPVTVNQPILGREGEAPAALLTEGATLAPLIDVRDVDWNYVWQVQRARQGSRKRDTRFWDGRASSFAKAASETAYADQFLAIMKPEAHWTVLDMGCGSGTLAVPLAGLVSSITAVDFSTQMLTVIGDRCGKEGICNVSTVHGRWEDDWENLGIGVHDVAIASRSMVADDLHASILKLNGVARRRVYIVTIVGDGPFDRRVFDAIGRPLNVGPDYIYNYNLLYQVGILANVAFIEERRNRTFRNHEEAFASMQWIFDNLTRQEEEKLHKYIDAHLVHRFGSWTFSYDHVVRWAVIWWEKA